MNVYEKQPIDMDAVRRDPHVWIVNKFHNRITRRKVSKYELLDGWYSHDVYSVHHTHHAALRAMVKHRLDDLEEAKKELARAERYLKSAQSIATRDGVEP